MLPWFDLRLVHGPVDVPDNPQVVAPAAWTALTPFPTDCGAECVFIGRTRLERSAAHGLLLRLEYEAYSGMAVAHFGTLATDAVERFDCRAVRLLHAVGAVAVGEASVLVQVAAAHRDASFLACRMLIDRLKAEAPIWKREVWADGATWSSGSIVADSSPVRAHPQ